MPRDNRPSFEDLASVETARELAKTKAFSFVYTEIQIFKRRPKEEPAAT